jgi:hypothetical protein
MESHETVPLLFREQDTKSAELTCSFRADLVEVIFPRDVGDSVAQRAWLEEHLWLQRQDIQSKPRSPGSPPGQPDFAEQELAPFLAARTWYLLRNVKVIEPIPINRLHKLDGDHPLAPNFIRGYALCHYPEELVKVLG